MSKPDILARRLVSAVLQPQSRNAATQARSWGHATSVVLPIATAAFALGIFIADTVTYLHIAVGVLYVAVVLMAARFCRALGVVLIAVGCVGLTVLSLLLTLGGGDEAAGIVNTFISISTIGLTTVLVLQSQAVEITLREQANLLNLTHDAIFVRDMRDIITYWNRGSQEFYGWMAEDAIGQHSHDLLRTIFPSPLAEIKAELLRTGRWEGDLVHTKRDGTQLMVTSRWALQLDESGNPAAVLETNNNITERKRAEEELHKVNEELEHRVMERTMELEAANKELEAFAYSVSHDLRAPLRHMVGYAELLQKSAAAMLDDKSRRYTLMILEAAKRMGTLIDDLLAFSRVGRAEIQKTTVSLEQVVKEALSEVRQETEGRDIVWHIGALPAVYGDHALLRLALVNLIANAVKFTRTRPQVEIEMGSTKGKNDEIVVFIRDNGVGFDMKYVNKLFGVFQRLHRTEEFEGTGIGLATVQRIIHRHGGRVWAEGLVNTGATFYVSLPTS
jgi:PAS domain S-box-containing protein